MDSVDTSEEVERNLIFQVVVAGRRRDRLHSSFSKMDAKSISLLFKLKDSFHDQIA